MMHFWQLTSSLNQDRVPDSTCMLLGYEVVDDWVYALASRHRVALS